jgi:hypothetical protein
MGGPFSRRHGYRGQPDITIREDAPQQLRVGFLQIAHDELGLRYTDIREVVCRTLGIFPDPANWSDIPNVRDEVRDHIQGCEWYRVYDICEAMYNYFFRRGLGEEGRFVANLNALFNEQGIGWQMIDGQLVTRGPDEFEHAMADAAALVEETGYQTVLRELREARLDLSRRPDPDRTGTIQHCIPALECAARELSGDQRATLGQIIDRRAADLGIPRPLDVAIERAWGYASEVGRHLREGREPSREEAELLLGLSATIIRYILQRNRQGQ